MTLGEKIRAARKIKGLTQKELAAKIGAAHNSISNWENDQNSPDPNTIQNLCWVLDVQPNYFFYDDESSRPLPPNIIPVPEMEKIPLLGQIACGVPILAEENIEDYVEAQKDVRADFALRCRGDSMIGDGIRDGDLVYIRKQDRVENNEIAAVLVDGDEATLKHFHFDGHALQLVSSNISVPPKVFVGEDMNRVRVIGKAVAFIHCLEYQE